MAHKYAAEAEAAGRVSREVNHALLIAHLCEFDGWALSTASTTLAEVLALAPDGVRIAAWVKPWASFKPGVSPAYCWEPVLFVPARKNRKGHPTARDFLSANITMRKGFCGQKPTDFSRWIFEILGAEPNDEFVDVFPGSGAVMEEWERFCGTEAPPELFAELGAEQ